MRKREKEGNGNGDLYYHHDDIMNHFERNQYKVLGFTAYTAPAVGLSQSLISSARFLGTSPEAEALPLGGQGMRPWHHDPIEQCGGS